MLWTQHIWSSAAQSVKGGIQRLVVSTAREYYYKFYFFAWNLPIRRNDFLWLFLVPGYLMIDTFRHEMSHALMAWLTGMRVLAIHIFPGRRLGYFSYGYTILDDQATWLIYAAPYICDLLIFTITFLLLRFAHFKHRWIYINLIMIGLISPIYNSFSGYFHSFTITNDVTRLIFIFTRRTITMLFLLEGVYYLELLRRIYRICIFNRRAKPPFWLAWAEGKKAMHRDWLVWP